MLPFPHVLVFGTFDVFHPGHLALLKEAARYGRVTVSLTPDALCRQYKGYRAHHSFVARAKLLSKLRYVHDVIPSDTTPNTYAILRKVKPTIIMLGHDQRARISIIRQQLRQMNLDTRIMVSTPYRRDLYTTMAILMRRTT